jgi:hypothetical protein
MLAKRCAGFLASALARMGTYSAGSLLRSGGCVRCFMRISPDDSPSKGTRPVSISYRITPDA